jgi:hypothetical protein
MKLANMLMILIVIQSVIILYDAVYTSSGNEGYTLESYGDNESKVWNFITDPSSWSESLFLIAVLALGATSATFIAIGTFLNTPSDSALFSPLFIIFIGVGFVPIVSMYHVFTRNISFFGCSSLPCPLATFAWVLTGGIIAIFYVLGVLEWWTGRSTG